MNRQIKIFCFFFHFYQTLCEIKIFFFFEQHYKTHSFFTVTTRTLIDLLDTVGFFGVYVEREVHR